MNSLPDLTKYGYQIETQLGCNQEGGRITWQGKRTEDEKTVVIKQFRFATTDTSWSGYQAYEREIDILKQLNHRGIPQYLASIETESGFCLIQEYIAASSLENCPQLTIAQVKEIVAKILEILIYLQQQNPPLIHRDLKPENILLDPELNPCLIDFGFASLGSQEVSGSSVFKGTPGFIAPEQIVKPTLASDLYSLGVTCVCLLSGKNIAEIRNFVSSDNPYQLNLKLLLPELKQENRQLFNWLTKMTEAKPSKRFSDAITAREALLAIAIEDEAENSLAIDRDFQLQKIFNPSLATGTIAITALSAVSVWGLNFIDHNLESDLANIAIAIVAAIVIAIAELGGVEIAQIDSQARIQGGFLGIGLPILLVIASGFIWGKGEAVDIAGMTAIAETLIFIYFWWRSPVLKNSNGRIKLSFLLFSLASGVAIGRKVL